MTSILHADGSWQPDAWRIVRDGDEPARDGDVLPLARWLTLAEADRARIGVLLAPEQEPGELEPSLTTVQLIAIDFPVFRDGRGYSTATLLRTRYHYRGELRAIGDVLVDQVFYMKRVGFSSFALRADQKPAYAEAALRSFSDAYQVSVDRPLPHYRRRVSATAATQR